MKECVYGSKTYITQAKDPVIINNVNILQRQNLLSPIHDIYLSLGIYMAMFRERTPTPGPLLPCKYFWSDQCFTLNLRAMNISFQSNNGISLVYLYILPNIYLPAFLFLNPVAHCLILCSLRTYIQLKTSQNVQIIGEIPYRDSNYACNK